jgi:hypothetical protein
MRYFVLASAFALAASAMLATAPARAEQIMSDGKCWVNTSNGNYGWTDCPKETHHKASKHK